MVQQGIDDPGHLLRRLRKVVAGPYLDQPRDGAGIELGLVSVAPHIQALELVHALLNDGPLQQMIQAPLFDQAQAFPLSIQVAGDCLNMLIDPVAMERDRAVDFFVHSASVLPDHVLNEIKIPVEGCPAHVGLLDQLGDGDLRQLLCFEQFKQGVSDVHNGASPSHDTNVSLMFHFPSIALASVRGIWYYY